jgi:hypothetical protein
VTAFARIRLRHLRSRQICRTAINQQLEYRSGDEPGQIVCGNTHRRECPFNGAARGRIALALISAALLLLRLGMKRVLFSL